MPYAIWLVSPPDSWKRATWDDVPPGQCEPLSCLGEEADLFAAVRRAIEFNQSAERSSDNRWAVVVESGTSGRRLSVGRLCTPLSYRVLAIWWPTGWEPNSPWDVPRCAWRAPVADQSADPMDYQKAFATVGALNRQSIDRASPLWYVIVAVQNEPLSRTVTFDSLGMETTVEVRNAHIVVPEEDSARGDCSFCPARALDCSQFPVQWADRTVKQTSA